MLANGKWDLTWCLKG